MKGKKKKVVSWEQRRNKIGYWFILPFMIGSVAFLIIPLITSLIYSLSNLTVSTTGYELEFVGIENFKQLLYGRSYISKGFSRSFNGTD